MADDAPSVETCRAAVADFWTRTAENDPARILGAFHPAAVSHDPVGAPPITTPEGHLALFKAVGGQFQDIRFRTETVYERPPFVSVRWFAEARLTDGSAASFDGLDVFEIGGDGLIRTHWGFWRPDDAGG